MHYKTAKANESEQKILRKELRSHATPAEAVLWKMLKGRNADGMKFRRQQGIGPYVLDFYCPELRLCVELDGSSHDYKYEYDEQRTEFLQKQGIRVLRFRNEHVWQGIDSVVDEIVRVGRLIKDDADFSLSP
jgi:very-short-patch-repair endonuclease